MTKSRTARILILCKTYPSPSGKYSETSCVAGMEEAGQMIRLFPVPFRLIRDDRQFKKWQWIRARITKASKDQRRESHNLFVDTIECEGKPLPTDDGWASRRAHLSRLPIFEDFGSLEAARLSSGMSLGLVRPSKITGLDLTPVTKPDWTPQEMEKLIQNQRQAGLFDETDATSFAVLRKLPVDFHYRYVCNNGNDEFQYRHKIVDWEIGALYWNCRHRYGAKWEAPFRKKIEQQLPSADLIFLMGTIHRFPDQWLIVSLIYPPMRRTAEPRQTSLFDH